LRILIVGFGNIGAKHPNALKKIKEVEVIPCDPREDVSKEVVGNYDLTEVYKDIKKVDLERIDRMVICTSPRTHVPIVLEGANFGMIHTQVLPLPFLTPTVF